MIDQIWPLILFALRIGVAVCLYLFLFSAFRALQAELRLRTTPPPVSAPAAARQSGSSRPESPAVALPSSAVPARLEVVACLAPDASSALVGRTYPLEGPTLVGRAASNAVELPEAHVSSRHARLLPDGEGWWVEDLGSTNGTYVDGRPVSGRARLPASGEVRFGSVVARVVPDGAPVTAILGERRRP